MRKLKVSIIIVINLILQSTLLQFFNINNIIPNTSLILVICLAINGDRKKGPLIGFVIGSLQDILFGEIIGLNTLIYLLIGYLISIVNKSIFKENFVIPIVFTVCGTLMYYIMGTFFIYFFGFNTDLLTIYKDMLIIEIIYNVIIAIFIYKYIYKIYRPVKNKY